MLKSLKSTCSVEIAHATVNGFDFFGKFWEEKLYFRSGVRSVCDRLIELCNNLLSIKHECLAYCILFSILYIYADTLV